MAFEYEWYLDGALLADAIGHLARIHPNGQLAGQILQDVGNWDATLAGGPIEHRIGRLAGLQAAERRALGDERMGLVCIF